MRGRAPLFGRFSVALAVCLMMLSLAACSGAPPAVPPTVPPTLSTSPPAAQSPSPSVDPSTLPRIDGRYVVLKRVTAVRHLPGIAVGDVLHRIYHVKPSCPIGPCGGAVRVYLAEAGASIRRTLAYDPSTHAYSLVPVISPVTCTGTDGRRYLLKNTTDTVLITPKETVPTGVDVIATTWAGVEVLKAVPSGPALTKGHCRTSVVNYLYTATRR